MSGRVLPLDAEKENRALEQAIYRLEGASSALNNFVDGNKNLSIETAYGLEWLALQIDAALVEVRNEWDAMRSKGA